MTAKNASSGATKKPFANQCGDECADWGVLRGFFFKTDYAYADGFAATSPVGSFAEGSPFEGVADLDGNVAEWTADLAGHGTPGVPAKRVVRGAAFIRYVVDPSAEPRAEVSESSTSHLVGFRCAANPKS